MNGFKWILILFLVMCSSEMRAENSKQDSLFILLKKEQFEKNELKNEFDSLQKKLEISEINESYFQSSIASMTGIYSAICGGFFVLFGLITYTGFRNEVRKVKKESEIAISKQKEKFDEFSNNVKDIEKTLTKQAARTYVLMSDFYDKSKMPALQIENNLRAAAQFSKLKEQDKGCNANIKMALLKFKEISVNDNLKDIFKEKCSELISLLDETNENKNINDESKDLIAELRISLKNYIK